MSKNKKPNETNDTRPCNPPDESIHGDTSSFVSSHETIIPTECRPPRPSSAGDTAASTVGPEILPEDNVSPSWAPPTEEGIKKPSGAAVAGIEDTRYDDKSLYSQEFRGASADAVEDGDRMPGERRDNARNNALLPASHREEASFHDGSNGSEDTHMDIVTMPQPTRQDSPLPHVPTAFLVEEQQPSSILIYDAVPVPNEPGWNKNRILLAMALVAFSGIVLITALLLTRDSGAPGAALGSSPDDTGPDLDPYTAAPSVRSFSGPQPTAMPSSVPSACLPLSVREALLPDGACADCGVQVATSTERAVVTVGNEVRFYRRTNLGWKPQPESFYLLVDGLRPSISASGSVVAVGAYRENNETGAVYVYENSGQNDNSTWRQSAQLVPLTDALSNGDRFGWSVGMEEDRILVGAEGRAGGAAYLFQRGEDGSWSQEVGIYPNYTYPQVFGSTVALAGNTLAVADVFVPTVFVYVYNESANIWAVSQEVSISDCSARFGRSIAIHEEGLAIGCDWDRDFAGAVYYFERSSSSSFLVEEYTLKQKLVASNRAGNEFFGNSNSVRMDGNIMTVGSFGAPNGLYNGRVYIFARSAPGDAWIQTENIASPEEGVGGKFGEWVTLAGRQVLVGSSTNAYYYELSDCQVL
ncbi:hypothetical protein ACHAW6_001554 [Cyclotella cf. meneghiniana]